MSSSKINRKRNPVKSTQGVRSQSKYQSMATELAPSDSKHIKVNVPASPDDKASVLGEQKLEQKEIIYLSDSDGDKCSATITRDTHHEENLENLQISLHGNQLEGNDDFIAFSDESDGEATSKVGQGEITEEIKSYQTDMNTVIDCPWIVNHDHSKEREVVDWLTLEIKDFVSYFSPSGAEIEARNKTIRAIREAVQDLWSDADLHVFGSYATDLYLPGSDLDCVVNTKAGNKENRNSLYELAAHLKKAGVATKIEVVANARVPIIKFVEPKSDIHIDVSFERTNGLEAAKLIRGWLKSMPGLRELVLVVKLFLHSRRLNNVHTGGLGGFSIICLVYCFLSMHPRIVAKEIDARDNLGVLLIDFFELYGKNFGYDDVAFKIKDNKPMLLPKRAWRNLQGARGGGSFTLAIQDPGDESNNISRGSFNLKDIKKAFAGAFDLLTNRCFDLYKQPTKAREGQSVLSIIVKYRGKPRDFKDDRALVANRAILENENYHKKRSIIMHGDAMQPTKRGLEITTDSEIEHKPKSKRSKKSSKSKKKKKSIASSKDIDDDDEESYNPLQSR